MDWSGIRDDTSAMSDPGKTDDLMLENGSLMVAGEFRRRPGFGARIENSGIVCAEINARVVFVLSNGDIQSNAQ